MDIRDLVAEEETYDPLALDDESEEPGADASDAQPLIGEPLDKANQEERVDVDERPASIRIRELLDQMPGQRRLLLKLIGYCREAKTGEEVDAYTAELQENAYSVYSSVILRELLEKAGAIVYLSDEEEEGGDAAPGEVSETDSAYEAGGAQEPSDAESSIKREAYEDEQEQVEVEYLEVDERALGAWLASDEGLAVVDAQNDEESTWNLLDKEPRYLGIYQRVIDFCTEDGGRSIKELDNLVNEDPLLREPRRYSGYFIIRLEKAGAIEWRNGWRTTAIGDVVLNALVSRAAKAAQETMTG